jgi:hypothetical protein
MSEYVRYYHEDRTHLGLAKDTPAGGRPQFVLPSKAKFVPSLGWAGCTTVMLWLRKS